LECGGRVGESKEHNQGFEEALTGLEGSFPFVAFLDLDIVIPLTDVELGKPPFANELVNEFLDEWKCEELTTDEEFLRRGR